MNTQRFILIAATAIVYLLILATAPLRLKYILKKAGNIIVPAQKKPIFMQVLILIFAALLIFLLFFRELGTAIDLIICLVAILGAAMGSEEAILSKVPGLYKNGIIFNGNFLPLSEIFALPTLSYSKAEQKKLNPCVLTITTDKKGTLNYIFSSEEEKKYIQDGLLQLNPSLKR